MLFDCVIGGNNMIKKNPHWTHIKGDNSIQTRIVKSFINDTCKSIKLKSNSDERVKGVVQFY